MQTALIDGDVVVYVAGFAAEECWYETEDGEIHGTMTQAKLHCDRIGADPTKISMRVEAEPKSHALRLVKNILLRVSDRTRAKELKVFLSGSNNFREGVAVTRPYKGNRSGRKPHHYQNIRDYLVDICGAEIINDMEADDALGINQTSDTCICTIDKDLDMVEGYHYNFRTDSFYNITEGLAVRHFYKQLLTGDTVDNIQGVKGVGIKTAEKILNPLTDEEDMFWAVHDEYVKKYDRPMEVMLEMGRLLWILREEGGMWEPKY